MYAGKYKNKLLQNLDDSVIERLRLRPVTLELRHEIEYPGSSVDHLFFIEEGAASMTSTFRDGSQVEIGLFGYESVIGVSALMGTKESLNRVYTQIAGSGFSSPIKAAKSEFELYGRFHDLALRYVQAQLILVGQAAACNAKHDLEQRLAKWLLICADRANKDDFSISQEFLADMLGSTRPTISVTAGSFKERGLIEYSRGTIRIRDAKGLEERSCECFRVVKDHLDNFTQFDHGFTTPEAIRPAS